MHKPDKRIVLLTVSATFLAFGLTLADAVEVEIPDANLEAALREALNKPTGPLTDSDLASLIYFDAGSEGISELTGLEYCVNLNRLYIWNNQIIDISPLSGLTNLISLYLSRNQIVDISPLSGLTNLNRLSLARNQIIDISPLSGLINLTRLDFGWNQIIEINPLTGLTNLTWLVLPRNQVIDVSPLSGLTNLTLLNLYGNQIIDISPLSGLTNLNWVALDINQIIDINPLSGLSSLDLLSLSRNQIIDISPLSGLTNLHEIDLYGNRVIDISPLVSNSGLGERDHVDLRRNPLDDQAYSVHIPALQARNVIVFFDFILNLGTGWHLISLPVQPQYTGVGSVLSSIWENYDSILTYKPNPGWYWHSPLAPFSNLQNIESGAGYWIDMKGSGKLVISRWEQPETAVPLKPGWNLVGYSWPTSRDIDGCMSTIEGEYNSVWEYDPPEGWRWYIPDAPDISNLWSMKPWYGYWIDARSDCLWDVGNTSP